MHGQGVASRSSGKEMRFMVAEAATRLAWAMNRDAMAMNGDATAVNSVGMVQLGQAMFWISKALQSSGKAKPRGGLDGQGRAMRRHRSDSR